MQNRWFGDKNDYLKYSIIRHIRFYGGLDVAINWMLTPNAGKPDPGKTRYLNNRDLRHFDPDVFDYLAEVINSRNVRDVAAMEVGGPIEGGRFFSEAVPDDKSERPEFLQRFLDSAGDVGLLFFDPDTGIETRTTPSGAAHKKFILLSELREAFQSGHSVLIYQHLARLVRDRAFHLREHVDDVAEALETDHVIPFRAEEVGFVLVTQPKHDSYLQHAMDSAVGAWRELPFWRPKL